MHAVIKINQNGKIDSTQPFVFNKSSKILNIHYIQQISFKDIFMFSHLHSFPSSCCLWLVSCAVCPCKWGGPHMVAGSTEPHYCAVHLLPLGDPEIPSPHDDLYHATNPVGVDPFPFTSLGTTRQVCLIKIVLTFVTYKTFITHTHIYIYFF